MAEKLSLRDYQRDLAERLRAAEGSYNVSMLALQVGEEGWLVDLADAGEVIPVPQITPVPLTRAWFKGVTNIRGNLYSVVDFPAFLGGRAVAVAEQSRLLLIGERFRMGSALLVDRSLGLRNEGGRAQMIRESLRGLVLAGAALSFSAICAEVGVSNDRVLLGQSVALTGPAAQLGIQMRIGL